MGWLGHCYEFGLGVEKNLSQAKDLYYSSFQNLGSTQKSEKFGIWLQERLEVLKYEFMPNSETRFINGIGNIRVVRGKYAYTPTRIRYNKDEVVIDIESRESLLSGFIYAEENLPSLYEKWTCDGVNKFYDGYTLETDFFTLKVFRGHYRSYSSVMDGRNLTIYVSDTVSFKFLYTQKYVLACAQKLLLKRAEVVIPQKLQEVADRIGTKFKKCAVVLSNRKWLARNLYWGSKIEFCAKTIQLPEKSFEAICIHELTHNYVNNHGSNFRKKMIELGGEEAYKLDQNLFEEGKWPYLTF